MYKNSELIIQILVINSVFLKQKFVMKIKDF